MQFSRFLFLCCLFLWNSSVISETSTENDQDEELTGLISNLETAEEETANRILCLLMKGHTTKCAIGYFCRALSQAKEILKGKCFPRALPTAGQQRLQDLIASDKPDRPCRRPQCIIKSLKSEATRWKLPKRKDSNTDASFYSGW